MHAKVESFVVASVRQVVRARVMCQRMFRRATSIKGSAKPFALLGAAKLVSPHSKQHSHGCNHTGAISLCQRRPLMLVKSPHRDSAQPLIVWQEAELVSGEKLSHH